MTEWDLTGDYDPPIAPDDDAELDDEGMGPTEYDLADGSENGETD